MTELQEKRCGEILKHYGVRSQQRQLIEECAELIQAVSKLHRASKPQQLARERKQAAFHDFLEELADVEIMVEQMKQSLNDRQRDTLSQIETAKLNRQLRRIVQGENK